MSGHPLRVRDYLGHRLDAAGQIGIYTRGKTAEQFAVDRLLQDAVIRNIEILGEASKNLLDAAPDIVLRFPRIPFTAIYAMRNQIPTDTLQLIWPSCGKSSSATFLSCEESWKRPSRI
jgi:uncharacterized protein with HEPN domain